MDEVGVAPGGRWVFLVASWFGLATGLLEGAGFLVLQRLGGLGRRVVVHSVSVEIVWISTVFNLLLFNLVALALLLGARVFPRISLARLAVSVFSVMACEALLVLALDGHMHLAAVIILGAGVGLTLARWLSAHETAAVRFWRRTLPGLGAAGLVALVGIEGATGIRERLAVASLPVAPPASPNVLVILADTLRADHLSGYGYARPTSPNIDRIAREGVLFEQAFSASSWTAPSHASLLTGLYPARHGVGLRRPTTLQDGRFPTLPEALHARGYRTAAFSANLFWFTRTNGFGRGFIRFEDYFQSIPDMAVRTIYGRGIEMLVFRPLGFQDIPARRRASDINRALFHWLDRDPDKPFFAFLNYMDTHDPYLPPPPYRGRFSTSANPGGLINERIGLADVRLTPAQRQGEVDAYDGAITYLDEHIGRLVEQLRARADTTIVVITADHGESFGEHGLFAHANSLFSPELHVPLIFASPGHIPREVRVARPVTNVDVAATVMDLVGARPGVLPGVPLRRLWEKPDAALDWAYPMAELEQVPWAPKNAPARHGSMRAVVTPRWHYILHEKLEARLYDRENDPGEQVDLAARPDMRPVTERLRAHLLEGSISGRAPTESR
jgi:arylsulfatase A-like enzyme